MLAAYKELSCLYSGGRCSLMIRWPPRFSSSCISGIWSSGQACLIASHPVIWGQHVCYMGRMKETYTRKSDHQSESQQGVRLGKSWDVLRKDHIDERPIDPSSGPSAPETARMNIGELTSSPSGASATIILGCSFIPRQSQSSNKISLASWYRRYGLDQHRSKAKGIKLTLWTAILIATARLGGTNNLSHGAAVVSLKFLLTHLQTH